MRANCKTCATRGKTRIHDAHLGVFDLSAAFAATYGLGRIAFDQRHDFAAAGNWFESYVKSFPQAPLRREAAGLMLESRLKAGDNARARDAADRYLDLFEDGPLAPKARDIRGH